jgi:UPF0755 protein
MRSRKKSSQFIAVVIFILLISSGVYYLFFPIGSVHKSVEIIIPRNATVRQVADSLKKTQVITSEKALLFWMKITKLERKIQAGRASFMTGDGVIRAARELLKTSAIEFSVTIPEGLTIEQTARKVHDSFKAIDTLQFATLCRDSVFIRELKLKLPSLEGYLYPETYRFPDDVTARDVIIKMVNSFEKNYITLVPDKKTITKFSKNEIITIASIVEKEAALSCEQTRISAVFHNRIRIGYPLGADPTVRYAVKKFNGPLTVSDLNNSSPYNTRKYVGLPPGPICSPGKGALQAAVAPADTKELYFVAKWDGSGAHDFSLTNEEHNRKKLIIRQYNEQRKRAKGKPVLVKGLE